jgi:hypothetical protein
MWSKKKRMSYGLLKLSCILNILDNLHYFPTGGIAPSPLHLLELWFDNFDIIHFSMFLCKSSDAGHEHLLWLHVVSYFLDMVQHVLDRFWWQGLYQKSSSWSISVQDVVVSISKDLGLWATAGTSRVNATRAPRRLGSLRLRPPIVWASHHSSSTVVSSMVDRQNDDRWAVRSGGKGTRAIDIGWSKRTNEGRNRTIGGKNVPRTITVANSFQTGVRKY